VDAVASFHVACVIRAWVLVVAVFRNAIALAISRKTLPLDARSALWTYRGDVDAMSVRRSASISRALVLVIAVLVYEHTLSSDFIEYSDRAIILWYARQPVVHACAVDTNLLCPGVAVVADDRLDDTVPGLGMAHFGQARVGVVAHDEIVVAPGPVVAVVVCAPVVVVAVELRVHALAGGGIALPDYTLDASFTVYEVGVPTFALALVSGALVFPALLLDAEVALVVVALVICVNTPASGGIAAVVGAKVLVVTVCAIVDTFSSTGFAPFSGAEVLVVAVNICENAIASLIVARVNRAVVLIVTDLALVLALTSAQVAGPVDALTLVTAILVDENARAGVLVMLDCLAGIRLLLTFSVIVLAFAVLAVVDCERLAIVTIDLWMSGTPRLWIADIICAVVIVKVVGYIEAVSSLRITRVVGAPVVVVAVNVREDAPASLLVARVHRAVILVIADGAIVLTLPGLGVACPSDAQTRGAAILLGIQTLASVLVVLEGMARFRLAAVCVLVLALAVFTVIARKRLVVVTIDLWMDGASRLRIAYILCAVVVVKVVRHIEAVPSLLVARVICAPVVVVAVNEMPLAQTRALIAFADIARRFIRTINLVDFASSAVRFIAPVVRAQMDVVGTFGRVAAETSVGIAHIVCAVESVGTDGTAIFAGTGLWIARVVGAHIAVVAVLANVHTATARVVTPIECTCISVVTYDLSVIAAPCLAVAPVHGACVAIVAFTLAFLALGGHVRAVSSLSIARVISGGVAIIAVLLVHSLNCGRLFAVVLPVVSHTCADGGPARKLARRRIDLVVLANGAVSGTDIERVWIRVVAAI